jgi:DNA mismatch repair protein MutS
MDYQTQHSYEVDPTQATPMVRQFLEVKQQYTGILLFYRMGDFYETFFEDALIAARVLEITLTGRDAGKLGKIPMAGIPVKAADNYLSRLLANNFKVAICEQMSDPATSKGLVDRKVIRVLSSGTVSDSSLLKPTEYNWLAALIPAKKPEDPSGLAYCDVTTGVFYAAQGALNDLLNELDRIRPAEVVVPGRVRRGIAGVDEVQAEVSPEITRQFQCTPMPAGASEETLRQLFGVETLDGFGLKELPMAYAAVAWVGGYLKSTFIDNLPTFDALRLLDFGEAVQLSGVTRRNLELLVTQRKQTVEGSLYSVLNKTATPMGARLLKAWVSRPLKTLPEIHARLDAVEALVQHPAALAELRQVLPNLYDLERLATRVANLTAMPKDLLALQASLAQLPEVAEILAPFEDFYLSRAKHQPPELADVSRAITQAIADNPPLTLKEGGLLRDDYHPELKQLRHLLATQEQWLARYETEERERTGIKSLKVQFTQAFGFYIEVSRAQSAGVPEEYRRKQTLTNAERYTTEKLKAFEAQVLDGQGRQADLEYNLYVAFRQTLLPVAGLLKEVAQRIAALDVLQSLATVAVEQHYCRPLVDDSYDINLVNARHPVVERMLPLGQFVANDCQLTARPDGQTPQLMLITGPNMAGKSTYMRQVALLVLMAQMGSFVPADYARIGWVDAIYTRVGAVDDLSSGQSTFMVEMTETALVLNSATERSLVILDEVGRGTSTFDGVSIAWSVAEFLVNEIGCRTLFATHYHEMNALESERIKNYRVCVSETEGDIVFLHRVEPGAAQKSYGIQVAKMAGVPQPVLRRAESILNTLQKRAMVPSAGKAQAEDVPQLTLF